MIVEQAIFGEVDGGHALRAASGDPAAAAQLAPRLDLPDTEPPGVDWSPFVSGFPHRDSFVFARTFRDSNAARAGMVLSHALIVPINDVVLAADLRPLFGCLIVEATAPSDLRTLDLTLGDETPLPAGDLSALAAALSTRAVGPVVRLGLHGFDDLVVSLWGTLWPAIRRSLAFRLSFGPADLIDTPQPVLVCTPPGLVARWRGHRLLEASASEPDSMAAAMLSGRSEGRALRSFAERIGAELTEFGDLPLLEKAYRFAVLEPDTIGNTVTAVRLAERLSPDPACGADGKGEMLNRLVLYLEDAAADEVLLLRNLVLHGFGQAERLWVALGNWAAKNAFAPAQDQSFRSIIGDATEASGSRADWRTAVLDGLLSAAQAPGTAFASAFWRWVAADPSIVEPLWEVVGASEGLEDRLVQVAPNRLTREVVEPILKQAQQDRLYRLYGATVSAAYRPVDAVRLQIAIEPLSSADGVRLALRNATPRELLACAVDIADPRVIQMAAQHVAKTPTLLADVDLSGEAAREIWTVSLERNLEAWRGPADPRAAFHSVLLDLIDGRPVAPELVDHISQTPLADLGGFARRTELWSKLTGSTRDALIRATASAWLDRARGGQSVSVLEAELQMAVISDPGLDELLRQCAYGRVDSAIQILAMLSDFDERRFRNWFRTVESYPRSIPPGDAEAIGRLIQERRWRSAVDDLLEMLRRRREDIRPALRACLPMIGMLDRWRFGLSAISSAEKWESLEELMSQLYPAGPHHNGLWERSGGHDADLGWTGNGRAQWRDSLGQIRRGGRGPSIKRLLREVRRDFPMNGSLRFLAEDREFGDRQ